MPSRFQAFAIHLALSLLVFSSLVVVMLVRWFPGELFVIDGGWQGLRLVAMVDLVLGPALTLLLYRPGKPKLLLDMALIAAIQIGALAYGFVTTYQQRTVAVVHAEKTFTTISAKEAREAADALRARDIEPREIGRLVAASDRAGASAPVPLLMAPDPDRDGFGQYLADLFNGLPPLSERSDKYVVLGGEASPPGRSALTLEALEPSGERAAVEAALAERSLSVDEVELHRFEARYAKGVAIYDPAGARILDYVPRGEAAGRADGAADGAADTAESGGD